VIESGLPAVNLTLVQPLTFDVKVNAGTTLSGARDAIAKLSALDWVSKAGRREVIDQISLDLSGFEASLRHKMESQVSLSLSLSWDLSLLYWWCLV